MQRTMNSRGWAVRKVEMVRRTRGKGVCCGSMPWYACKVSFLTARRMSKNLMPGVRSWRRWRERGEEAYRLLIERRGCIPNFGTLIRALHGRQRRSGSFVRGEGRTSTQGETLMCPWEEQVTEGRLVRDRGEVCVEIGNGEEE